MLDEGPNDLIDRAVFSNPQSAIRNPNSKGWMLDKKDHFLLKNEGSKLES
jgi:hypothetical protein